MRAVKPHIEGVKNISNKTPETLLMIAKGLGAYWNRMGLQATPAIARVVADYPELAAYADGIFRGWEREAIDANDGVE